MMATTVFFASLNVRNGVVLGVYEQKVRLCWRVFEFQRAVIGGARHNTYEVVISPSCVVQIHYNNGDGG